MIYIDFEKWQVKYLNIKQDLKNQTIISCFCQLSICTGWKLSQALKNFEVTLMITVDGNKEEIQKATKIKTHFYDNHKHVLFTWMYLSQRQNKGFVGILQAYEQLVYHWHHIHYFMVFYLWN